MELNQIAVPCFSIGSVLAPSSWTIDMHSHHTPFSIPARSNSLHLSLRDFSFWSSNTVYFEKLDFYGSTLYVTEIFAFRYDLSKRCFGYCQKHVCSKIASSTYELQNEVDLLAKKTPASPMHRVRIVEVTEQNLREVLAPHASTTFSSSFMSKAAWLRSQNYRIFLQISLDNFSAPLDVTTDNIDRIVKDAISKYQKPFVQVPDVLLPVLSALDSLVSVDEGNIPADTHIQTRCFCDPPGAHERLRSFFYTRAIYSNLGRALIVLRETCRSSGSRDPSPIVVCNPVYFTHPSICGETCPQLYMLPHKGPSTVSQQGEDSKSTPNGKLVVCDRETDKTELKNSNILHSVTAVLRSLVRCTLGLDSGEDLSLALGCEFKEHVSPSTGDDEDNLHRAGSCKARMSLAAVRVSTFLLAPEMTSIYDYPLIEYAFEKHVEAARQAQRDAHEYSEVDCTENDIGEIKLVRLWRSKRDSPSEDFLRIHQDKIEWERTWSDSGMKHALRNFQTALCLPVSCRSTLYAVCRKDANHCQGAGYERDDAEPPLSCGVREQGAPQLSISRDVLFVAQLIAPRMNSRHAIVIVAAVDSQTMMECNGTLQAAMPRARVSTMTYPPSFDLYEAAALLLARTFRLEFPHPKRWLLLGASKSAACFIFRQGLLVVRVPSGDPRYCDTCVRPNASKCFTSLGSLTVHSSYMEHYPKDCDVCPHDKARCGASIIPVASLEATNTNCISSDNLTKMTTPETEANLKLSPPYSSSVFNNLSAAWTLLEDGRSADEFLDFYISEFYYSSGVLNINNVARRTTAMEQGRSIMAVRKRLSRIPASTVSLQFHRERREATAWLDLGSHHRLYVCTRDCGVGRILLIEASILLGGEDSSVGDANKDMHHQSMRECEEKSLEAWIEGISAGLIDI